MLYDYDMPDVKKRQGPGGSGDDGGGPEGELGGGLGGGHGGGGDGGGAGGGGDGGEEGGGGVYSSTELRKAVADAVAQVEARAHAPVKSLTV